MVTIEQVKSLIEKYQQLLHLQDWMIDGQVVSKDFFEMITNGAGALGLAIIRAETRLANIYIGNQADENAEGITLEYIVVHELVHILLKPIADIFDAVSMRIHNNQALVYWITSQHHAAIETLDNMITRIILESHNVPIRMSEIDRQQRVIDELIKIRGGSNGKKEKAQKTLTDKW